MRTYRTGRARDFRRKGPFALMLEARRWPCGRQINAVIRGMELGEERWWHRNRNVIAYLDEGRSVREISILTQQGPGR